MAPRRTAHHAQPLRKDLKTKEQGVGFPQSRRDAMTKRTQVLAFATLAVVSFALWWHPLVATFHLALTNDAYTHILLILPLSIGLIYLDSKALQMPSQPSPWIGTVLLLVAGATGCYAKLGVAPAPGLTRLSVSMLALVICWIAGVILCFGVTTLRSLLFPLCLLFLIVPIPEFALDRIVEFLQLQSAFASRIMFRMAGVPATQDGIMVSIPGLDIEVAQECSSIRSSLLLVVTTMVMAHLFLRSWWRKALLIAVAIPLSVAKNGLRIFTIAELGTRVDPSFLTGRLHHQGGIVFFGVSVMAMGSMLWALRRTELPLPKSP
jgi:exosortase